MHFILAEMQVWRERDILASIFESLNFLEKKLSCLATINQNSCQSDGQNDIKSNTGSRFQIKHSETKLKLLSIVRFYLKQ